MTYLLHGLRAATLCALILTCLSFVGVDEALEHADELSGLLYVATAFGLLGLPCLLLGALLGALLDLWSEALAHVSGPRWLKHAFELKPAHAPALWLRLAPPLLAALLVTATHAAITSGFQRVTFQALGLGAVMIVALIAASALIPLLLAKLLPNPPPGEGGAPQDALSDDARAAALLLGVPVVAAVGGVALILSFEALVAPLSKAPQLAALFGLSAAIGAVVCGAAPSLLGPLSQALRRRADTSSAATRLALRVVVAALIAVTFAAYFYAKSLGVWTPQTLLMSCLMVLGPVLLLGPIGLIRIDRIFWRVGIPVAGLLSALVCFFGAWSWASSSETMRSAVTQQSALLAEMAQALQRFGDRDKDGHAGSLGGADCDDARADIYPGAKDLPDNGVDEDCDGQDAARPGLDNHPVKRAVSAALSSARRDLKSLSEAAPPKPPKNIVLILVDTLRYDHMGFAGYPRSTSPHIDALASESIVFERAYATAPHTPRSIPSLFFGRYPSQMDWRGGQYNYPKVKPENLGLFEILAERGWSNHGLSSHFYFEPKRGMDQGFASWDNSGAGTIKESNDDIAAPRIWQRAQPKLAELAAQAKGSEQSAPFSMFIHFFEPHSRWIGHDAHDFGPGSTPVERHMNNYDSEIAYVDTYVAKVIEELKRLEIYDETVLILTSDHGEAFNEHKVLFHGTNLYDEVIHVPLIVRVPGWKPRRVEGAVSLVDVAPTLLDLYGITAPPDFVGVSLREAMLGEEDVPLRPVFSELLPYTSWKEHHKAVIYGDKKLIKVFTANTTELYDLADDPAEQQNLARTDPEAAARLSALLSDWINAQ